MRREAQQHFERIAGAYDSLRSAWPLGPMREQEQRAVRALVGMRPGDRVLDVGCGDGDTLAWVAGRGALPVGIDLALAMAARCQRRGFPVCVQDMEQLGVIACFDWVLCIGSLEFTMDPAHTIKELASCLRQGGRLALLFPRRHVLGRLYAAYHRTHGIRIHLFSRAEITACLSAAGLRLQDDWRNCALSTVCIAQRAAQD